MGMHSKSKGKRGELEAASLLRSHGMDARRAQQFKGTADSADLECPTLEALGLHLEVKRQEKMHLWGWMDQCLADVGEGQKPLILYRPNGKPWVAIMLAEDFLGTLNRLGVRDDEPDPLG